MSEPQPSTGETTRLQTLNALKILDTPRQQRFDRITKLAQRLLDVPVALLSLVDEDRIWFTSRPGFGGDTIARADALCEYALHTDAMLVVEDTTRDERFRDNPVVTGAGIRFYAGCPVCAQDGSRLGTLWILDTVPRKLAPADFDSMQDLGHMIEDELSSLTMATTDELTGLANRRGFRSIAEPMIALCQRAWHPATIVMFDLDGLKKINDEFGHDIGDLAIKDFGKLLLKAFRHSDIVARVGGDEFCVLLTNPDEADPAAAIARLQSRVESHNAASQRPYTLNFSSGAVAFKKKHHTCVDHLLRDADHLMYCQKRGKANTVI